MKRFIDDMVCSSQLMLKTPQLVLLTVLLIASGFIVSLLSFTSLNPYLSNFMPTLGVNLMALFILFLAAYNVGELLFIGACGDGKQLKWQSLMITIISALFAVSIVVWLL